MAILQSKYLAIGENLIKIGQVNPEIICLKDSFLNEGMHPDDPVKLPYYWTKIHQIYTQSNQIIGMSGLRIKVNSPILRILTLNWLPWQRPLCHRKTGSNRQSTINTHHMVKIW